MYRRPATTREKREVERLRDEASSEGLDLSEHKRNPPSAWDDIFISSRREGKPYRWKPARWPKSWFNKSK